MQISPPNATLDGPDDGRLGSRQGHDVKLNQLHRPEPNGGRSDPKCGLAREAFLNEARDSSTYPAVCVWTRRLARLLQRQRVFVGVLDRRRLTGRRRRGLAGRYRRRRGLLRRQLT